jgi:MinD superfamily P-loop ATPase
MKIAVASGKGGTGKTTVSASLISAWGGPLIAVDLDVEEPNLHLFLQPDLEQEMPAYMRIPEIDLERCTRCGACAQICQFKAISVFGETVMTFPEMCHGCQACKAVCPEGAITKGRRHLGDIQWGRSRSGRFLMGRLRVGEAMSPPLMRMVKEELEAYLDKEPGDAVIDSPPGVSCPAVNAVMDADVILLVTEPTPFGLYDLKLAHEAFASFDKPMGVIVNRAGIGDGKVQQYCRSSELPVIAEIPFDREVAAAYAAGQVIADFSEDYHHLFCDLAARIRALGVDSNRVTEVAHA